ncbi:MAG TPA: HAMP domain-containing protein, partial [Candidatus Obscuribacterales bacterium]
MASVFNKIFKQGDGAQFSFSLPTSRLGVALQLIIPFVIISVLTTLCLGGVSCWKMSSELSRSLEEKARILTMNLSAVLGDPFSMGEYDHMQQILESAQKSDPDLNYAIVMSSDGRAVATTDPALKNARLTGTDFEKSALTATDFVRRGNPKDPNIFETVMPIRTAGGQAGILRLGISQQRAQNAINMSILFIACIGLAALAVGCVFYYFIINRTIIGPIGQAVEIASHISQGDLVEAPPVTRTDEIGKLLQSMNDMIEYLREMANTADSIASGDLSV